MCRDGRVSRIGMIVIELCQLRASSLFLLAALGFLFGSRSSWLLLRTLPRPPEVDEEALVVHLPAAGHGARHPSRRGEAGRGGGGAAAYQLVRGECGGVAHHQPLEEERLVFRRQLEQRRVRLVHQAHHACRHAGAQGRRGSEASRRRLLLPQALQCTAAYTTRRRSGITLTLTLTLTLGPALVLTLTLTPTLTQALRCGGAGVARVRRLAAAWRSPLTVTHALDLVGALLATEGLLLYHDVVAHEQVY